MQQQISENLTVLRLDRLLGSETNKLADIKGSTMPCPKCNAAKEAVTDGRNMTVDR